MARHPFLDHPGPIPFAHRGGGAEAEENTMAAFARAVALGYRYIETDVQVSRDGAAIIHHDDTLARLFGRPERVDALTRAELASLRSPGGEAPPLLEDALAAFPAIRFNLEPKTDAAIEPVARAIERTRALDRVCIGCFDGRRTRALRRRLGPGLCWSPARPGVTLLWLAAHRLPVPRLAFPCVQIPLAHRGIPLVTPALVAAARRHGIAVHVWTIDEEPQMERLLDIGVDGIMTGRPALLKSVLTRRGLWRD